MLQASQDNFSSLWLKRSIEQNQLSVKAVLKLTVGVTQLWAATKPEVGQKRATISIVFRGGSSFSSWRCNKSWVARTELLAGVCEWMTIVCYALMVRSLMNIYLSSAPSLLSGLLFGLGSQILGFHVDWWMYWNGLLECQRQGFWNLLMQCAIAAAYGGREISGYFSIKLLVWIRWLCNWLILYGSS